MYQGSFFFKASMAGILAAGLFAVDSVAFAQAKPATVPDAQIEANVLKALAGAPQLADQAITSTTVYGTVTLSGTVRDEASRDMAEEVVSNAAGVKKVIDQLAIGTNATGDNGAQQDQNAAGAEQGTNPNLQSDGTMAPSPAPAQVQQNQSAPDASSTPPAGQYPQPSQQQPPGQQPPPQQQQPQYRQPYGAPPPAYGQQQPQQPYVAQRGGDSVLVPSGSLLRVRINQAMDSRHTQPGTVFDGVVLSDVVAGGFIAIPRGAAIQGVVADAHTAGQLKGRGELSLQLTQVTLGGRTYPLASNLWSQQGADKTGNTVGNTVGLGAMGALIGAVAGGGAGAAVGAGIGSVAGLGVSSASKAGEVAIPSEAILSFQLTQPVEMTTVSQDELNRLGSGVPLPQQQQQLRQRYYPPPPPPPPYYYQPNYYYSR